MADKGDIDKVAKVLVARAKVEPARAVALATAYLDASTARAVAVATGRELPPTAMRTANVSLVIELVERFEAGVPTEAELAALLRMTHTAARSLLNQVLASSDTAANRLLKAVFKAAKKGGRTGPDAEVPNGYEWTFTSYSEMALARQRLEFSQIDYATRSHTDGDYVLLVDRTFDPDKL